MVVLKAVQILFNSIRNNVLGLEVTGDDSKALNARSRRPITSNFKASIRDLLKKLVWLPPSKRQRVFLLAPFGPITSNLAVCRYVKLEETTFILSTVFGGDFGGLALVSASMQIDL